MSKSEKKQAAILASLLADVKIADADWRRTTRNSVTPEKGNLSYEALSDSVVKLYTFLRETPIAKIERMLSV